jgi:hypothetical protein
MGFRSARWRFDGLAPSMLILLLLCVAPLAAQTVDWAEMRGRAGNDDLFIMVDSSLSMAESSGGIMPQVRNFLAELFTKYLKTGDRVIVMTFDSEARYQSVVDVHSERDLALLDSLARGIDSHRAIYLQQRNGALQEVPRETPGAMPGGGMWTDYCAMWQLASDAMHRYSDPRHRQLFLLFTDGEPEAPPYRACERPEVLEAFAAGVRNDAFRFGVVALPTGNDEADRLALKLRELLRSISPQSVANKHPSFRMIEYDRQHGMSSVRQELHILMYSRVDLAPITDIRLEDAYRPHLDQMFTLTNQSDITRTIRVPTATLTIGPLRQRLNVVPPEVKIAPRSSATIRIATDPLRLPVGTHAGTIDFQFDGPSRFTPTVVGVTARKQTWWEAYGPIATALVGALAVALMLILMMILYRRSLAFAPAQVEARYGSSRPFPSREVQIGEPVAFGGGGVIDGELFVDRSSVPRGLLIRDGVDDWKVSWEDGADTRPYSPGSTVHPDPHATEGWKFLVTLNDRHTLHGVVSWLSHLRGGRSAQS